MVIQDSTSFNLNQHYYRIKKDSGIGPIEDNHHVGFFAHASLVLDAFSDVVLGLGDLQLWHRVYDDPARASKIRSIPIEHKESYKWIRACRSIQSRFTQANSITFVEDRDGDIYEQFATVPDAKTHLVIRCCKDRRLAQGDKLYDTFKSVEASGQYQIKLDANPRSKRMSRTAEVEVRYKKVTLLKPSTHINKDLPEQIQLYAVEAKEKNNTGKDRICWRILTTHQVNNYETALQIIEIYRKRWYIEQLFRLLKKQGFELEDSQLESGWAIRKLCVFGMNTVIRVMQMMLADEEEKQPASTVFDSSEQQCLTQLTKNYEGKTAKQKNPYTPYSLLWAKWIIARLGGWKSYQSQRPPGPITLKRGLDIFNQIYTGWQLALNGLKDVGTR